MSTQRYISIAVVTCLIFFFSLPLTAREFSREEIKKSLPKLLGTTNEGTDFFFTFPPGWELESNLMIYVSSSVKTLVTCEIPGKQIKYQLFTTPNEVVTIKLWTGEGQCYRKSEKEPPEPEKIYKGSAVHMHSDYPIVVYTISNHAYNTEGFLAIPAKYCGTEYITASWADPANNTQQWMTSYTGLVGISDSTNVVFTMGGNKFSTTAGGLKPGESSKWILNSTDVLLIGAVGSHSEMTGSKIVSDKPIAIVSGNFSALIPTDSYGYEHLSEMEMPTNSWGKSYLVSPFCDRKKSSFLKVFAKEPMTKVFSNGREIGTIKTAGGIQDEGWLCFRADSSGNNPVIISGDKPISVTQFNTGPSDDGVPSKPFQMQLFPVEMFQNEIWFNTPGIRGGSGFPKNYINVCYKPTQDGNIPHEMILFDYYNNIIVNRIDTMAVLSGGNFEDTTLSSRWAYLTIKLPHDGVYFLKSTTPIAVYQYGYTDYCSYGFPAYNFEFSPNFHSDKLVPVIVKGKGSSTVIGQVYDLTYLPSTKIGIADIKLINDSNCSLLVDDYSKCKDSIVNWTLNVIDRRYNARAELNFKDCNNQDTTISLEYIAPNYTEIFVSDILETFTFRDTSKLIGIPFTISNRGNIPLIVNGYKSEDSFIIINDSVSKELEFPITIQMGDSIRCLAYFKLPTEFPSGIQSNVIFRSNALISDSILQIDIEIVDKTDPVIEVDDIDFGNVPKMTTKTITAYIKNKGEKDLHIYSLDSARRSEFKVKTGKDIPFDISGGDSIPFIVEFTAGKISVFPILDIMKFISNSYEHDSICYLRAFPIESDIKDNDLGNFVTINPEAVSERMLVHLSDRVNVSDIEIYNQLGLRVFSKKLEFGNATDNIELNLSDLSSGVYYIRLNTGEKVFSQKFIIVR